MTDAHAEWKSWQDEYRKLADVPDVAQAAIDYDVASHRMYKVIGALSNLPDVAFDPLYGAAKKILGLEDKRVGFETAIAESGTGVVIFDSRTEIELAAQGVRGIVETRQRELEWQKFRNNTDGE